MTDAKLVDYHLEDGVAVIRLNQPETRNAMSRAMGPQLMACLDRAEQEARAIVLTHAGSAFCSGAALGGGIDFNDPVIDMGEWLEKLYNPMIIKMRELPVPFITAIGGPAVGLGSSLGLMGDIIIAGRSAFFLQSFAKIGLVPDGGCAYLLSRSIGRVRAMELMLLGERYSAEQAYKDGLVTRLVEDGEVDAVAMDIARQLASGPAQSLSIIRKSAWMALESNLDAQLNRERRDQRTASRTPDFREGVQAFKEKREPKFSER